MGLTSAGLSRFRAAATVSLVETFRERLAALGEEIFLGVSIRVRVLIAAGDYTRELVEGGFADAGTVRVNFLRENLSALPELGSAATYQGRPYRVRLATLTPGAEIGLIELRPVRR